MRNLHNIRLQYSDLEKAKIYAVQQYLNSGWNVISLKPDDVVEWWDTQRTVNWKMSEHDLPFYLVKWNDAGRPEPKPFYVRKR